MNYKSVTIDDLDVFKKFLPFCRICDYTLGTFFMWKDYYKFMYTIEDDILFVKGESVSHDRTAFFPPLGKGDKVKAVEKVVAYAKQNNVMPFFSPICKELLSVFGNNGIVTKLDDWSDYLYDVESFCTLAGKKLHGKRNHINKFKSMYDYKFAEIDQSNMDKVRQFLVDFDNGDFGETAEYENNATIKILNYWDKFDFLGGVLTVNGKIVGISIGEMSGDTLVVHTEKALRDYEGSYEMLANCFANANRQNAKYINREEDMGIAGLRQAKESYQPIEMLEKFNVEIK